MVGSALLGDLFTIKFEKMRTQDEIRRQVELLENKKINLPRLNAFGDSNWEKIDAQIEVLEGRATPDDFYIDETSDEFEDGDNDVWSAADEAAEWLKNPNASDLVEAD